MNTNNPNSKQGNMSFYGKETPYLQVFENAWKTRFQNTSGKPPIGYAAVGAEAKPVEPVRREAAPVALAAAPAAPAKKVQGKTLVKRRSAIMIFVVLFSILVVAFAALNYFGVINDLIGDKIVGGKEGDPTVGIDGLAFSNITPLTDIRDLVDTVIDGPVDGAEVEDYLAYAAPIALLVAVVLSLVVVIVAIVALASRKKIHILVASILAFVFALAAGGLYFGNAYMLNEGLEIVDFINPLKTEIGLQIGYFIILILTFLSMFLSFFSYGKKKHYAK